MTEYNRIKEEIHKITQYIIILIQYRQKLELNDKLYNIKLNKINKQLNYLYDTKHNLFIKLKQL